MFQEILEPNLERETGFEPATSTLARLHSTTELFPLGPSFTLVLYNNRLGLSRFFAGRSAPLAGKQKGR